MPCEYLRCHSSVFGVLSVFVVPYRYFAVICRYLWCHTSVCFGILILWCHTSIYGTIPIYVVSCRYVVPYHYFGAALVSWCHTVIVVPYRYLRYHADICGAVAVLWYYTGICGDIPLLCHTSMGGAIPIFSCTVYHKTAVDGGQSWYPGPPSGQ